MTTIYLPTNISAITIDVLEGLFRKKQQKEMKEALTDIEKVMIEDVDRIFEALLEIIPVEASEEEYQKAIQKLPKVYSRLYPDKIGELKTISLQYTSEELVKQFQEYLLPKIRQLKEEIAKTGDDLWEIALNGELSHQEIEELELINNWLFLTAKLLGISERIDDMGKAMELLSYVIILQLRGIKLAKEHKLPELKKDFEVILNKITSIGYTPQVTDDHLIFEILE